MNSIAPKLILFDHPVSCYTQKVPIVLREKQMAFESELPFGAGDPTSAFLAASPRAEIPALINGSDSIFDSTIILEYLEDLQPEPALLPPRSDPGARARVRMVEDIADTQYEGINWVWTEAIWMGRAGEDTPYNKLRNHLKAQVEEQTRELYIWFEERLGKHDYFGGAHGFTWADAALAPLVHRSKYFGWPPAENSPLALWYERCLERPSVKQTLKEFDDNLHLMAKVAAMFQSGKKRREFRDHRLEALIRSGGLCMVQDGIQKQNVKFSWPKPEGAQLVEGAGDSHGPFWRRWWR